MSLWGRLMNVFAVPGEVFEQVRHAPLQLTNWVVPGVLLVLVGWASGFIIFAQPAVKQQLAEISSHAIEQQIQRQNASPEQAEQMRAAAEKFGGIGQQVSMVVAPVVGAFATPFIWGLFLWLVGTKVLGGAFPYMKAVEVVGLAGMISVLDAIIKTLLIVLLGSVWAAPNPALFLTDFDPQKPVHAILAAVNIMTFWVLAVRASGLARLSGARFGKAAAWVFGVWLTYTALFMGFGFAMQAIFSSLGSNR